jgi:hypothetical protein
MDMLGHPEVGTGMPASSVQDQHDLLVGTGSYRLGKGRQFCFKERIETLVAR